MSKRPSEDIDQASKKVKGEDHTNDIAIDSELIAHQSSYESNKKSQAAANYSGSAPDSSSHTHLQLSPAHVHQGQQPSPQPQRSQPQSSIPQIHSHHDSHDSHHDDNGVSSAVSSAVAASFAKNAPTTTTMSIQPTTLPSDKPAPGSEEWHKLRRENHKEVEKRRRENINSGIRELAALIPTSDTNKAQILQRAVEYIKRLKENETNNIEKWTLEKLLTEQAVSELDASNTKLKQELERAYREIEHYKRLVEKKD